MTPVAGYSHQFYRVYACSASYIGCAFLGHSLITQLIHKVGLEKIYAVGAVIYIGCASVIANVAIQDSFLTSGVLSVIWVVTALFSGVKKSEEATLPDYMEDLTEKAKKIEKCPYSGFDGYIQQLEVILCQREKNNGVLVGPAGIGKSAIYETLAWQIAHKKTSPNSPFAGKRLIGVSAAGLVAGTMLRGDLEKRVQKFLKIAEQDPTVVYCIDEIHKLVGAGSNIFEKNGDIANQLKPALARPGLKILGATTGPEFIRYIQNDPTLERRFKKVDVVPPNSQACLEMLQARRAQDYYIYNGKKCQISDDAFKAAIFFAKRDNPRRQLPDVANDLIDHVCAEESLSSTADQIDVTVDMIMKAHAKMCSKNTLEQLRKQFDALVQHQYIFTRQPEMENTNTYLKDP